MSDEISRAMMLEIPEGYERLAKHAEERARKRGRPRAPLVRRRLRFALSAQTAMRSSGVIPKLADPDSCCERPTRTFIAKTYGGPMGYGRGARTRTVAQMSQCLRSLV